MESNIKNSDTRTMAATNQRKGFEGIRLENPFTLKVGQVFTGFGVGCGIGIGVGRPINLGGIPMLGEVMSATRGATDAFSGVSRHVNGALRKLGAKNIEAGVGCGVGVGHGFGIGLAVKPGVLHQLQCCVTQGMTNLMNKFGIAPNFPFAEGSFPESFQSGLTTTNEPSVQGLHGNLKQLVSKPPLSTSQGLSQPVNMSRGSANEKFSSETLNETSFGSRTEKVLNSFLQSPLLKEDETSLSDLAGRLRSENNMLQLVMLLFSYYFIHPILSHLFSDVFTKKIIDWLRAMVIGCAETSANYRGAYGGESEASSDTHGRPENTTLQAPSQILRSGEALQPDNAEVVLTIIKCEPEEKDSEDSLKTQQHRKNECDSSSWFWAKNPDQVLTLEL
ncbi:hypothetical protein V6N11_081801 [Hibiscus sabdariffa]|uniref:Uncharacterized protein n=1 Tax=Hibiscus sabdariffa TaxID=183260 RepID=A0ABR2Q774_9ROSI